MVGCWQGYEDGVMVATPVVTRFAPSPTGDLHLGGALVALASFMLARGNGVMRLRVEDLDPPRVVAGSAERILEDLAWLGIEWSEPVVWQSTRTHAYEKAIAALSQKGLVYPCDCSRAEIARVASAPHEGEEVVYPGSCRDKDPAREMKREPALRMRVSGRFAFDDEVMGRVDQDLLRDVGDFVLRRGDGVFAYQLAVAIDDADMGITKVVRGRDLLASTPRQLYLMSQLNELSPPTYAHVPLVVAPGGERLSKRTPKSRVRELRDAKVPQRIVLEWLLNTLGARSIDDRITWPRHDVEIPSRW
jgi:glutamyl-queuosine tRNA(Asp) synthetase